MKIKERILLLGVLCVMGLGACIFAHKHGPFNLKSNASQPPPGWIPPQAQPQQTPPGVTPTPPGVQPPPAQPPQQRPQQQRPPQRQQRGPDCGPGG